MLSVTFVFASLCKILPQTWTKSGQINSISAQTGYSFLSDWPDLLFRLARLCGAEVLRLAPPSGLARLSESLESKRTRSERTLASSEGSSAVHWQEPDI